MKIILRGNKLLGGFLLMVILLVASSGIALANTTYEYDMNTSHSEITNPSAAQFKYVRRPSNNVAVNTTAVTTGDRVWLSGKVRASSYSAANRISLPATLKGIVTIEADIRVEGPLVSSSSSLGDCRFLEITNGTNPIFVVGSGYQQTNGLFRFYSYWVDNDLGTQSFNPTDTFTYKNMHRIKVILNTDNSEMVAWYVNDVLIQSNITNVKYCDLGVSRIYTRHYSASTATDYYMLDNVKATRELQMFFKDSSQTSVSSLDGITDSTLNVTANIINTGHYNNGGTDFVLIVCAYNGSELLSASFEPATIAQSNTATDINLSNYNIPQGTTEIKAFVWNSLNGLIPFSNSKSIQ